MSELRADGFEPYLTSVGGSGVGILSPYPPSVKPNALDAPATPPETPGEEDIVDVADEVSDGLTEPIRSAFETKPTAGFSTWADRIGRWLYV